MSPRSLDLDGRIVRLTRRRCSGIPARRLPPVLRLTLRNMVRGRWRTLASVIGIMLSVAMVTAVMGMLDSINNAFDTQFEVVQKQEIKVSFTEPVHLQKVEVMQSWPEVDKAEA